VLYRSWDCFLVFFWGEAKYYNRAFARNGKKPVLEARLPPMMVESILFAAGLFIFGWISDKSISWIAPVIATVLMGFEFFTIFHCALNYLIDTFQRYAASAVAAKTFLRSVFVAAFPRKSGSTSFFPFTNICCLSKDKSRWIFA